MWYSLLNRILLLSFFLNITQAEECIFRNSYLESLLCEKIVDPETNCIIRYDCTNTLKREVGIDQCFYGGMVYNRRSRIEAAKDYCDFGCYCGKDSKIVCAQRDCPIYETPLEQGCYYAKDHGCCPIEIVCDTREDQPICEYDGKEYLEGMEFFPEPCTKCICREGFSGEIEAPFCKEIQCLADITYYIHLKRKCAPIYLKDQCCPELFTCPHPTDKIITHQDDAYHMLPTSSDSESNFGSGLLYDYTDLVNMCVYGDDVLEIGDEVIVSSVVNARCTCITPPVLTCLAV